MALALIGTRQQTRRYARPAGPFQVNRHAPLVERLRFWLPMHPQYALGWEMIRQRAWQKGFFGYPTVVSHPTLSGCFFYDGANYTNRIPFSSWGSNYLQSTIAPPWTVAVWYHKVADADSATLLNGTDTFKLQQYNTHTTVGLTVGGTDYYTDLAGDTKQPSLLAWVQPQSGNVQVYVDTKAATFQNGNPANRSFTLTDLISEHPYGYLADLRVWDVALTRSDLYRLWAPETRWDLYSVPSSRVFFDLSAGAALTAAQEAGIFALQNAGAMTGQVYV